MLLIEELVDVIDLLGIDMLVLVVVFVGWLVDDDLVVLFYMFGFIGKLKGVVVLYCNLVLGVFSVVVYQWFVVDDVVFGVLLFSFDVGLSQFMIVLVFGVCYMLFDFLQLVEVLCYCDVFGVMLIIGVLLLWMQFVLVGWSDIVCMWFCCFVNIGGYFVMLLLYCLQVLFMQVLLYLMYGLIEVFCLIYLLFVDVVLCLMLIGKVVLNVEIFVLCVDGSECVVDEFGEFVYCGVFVMFGYWNWFELIVQCFCLLLCWYGEILCLDVVVWLGDIVWCDVDGYLYFVVCGDDMIKMFGYCVSLIEVEDVLFVLLYICEVVVFSVLYFVFGEVIVVCVVLMFDVDVCCVDIVCVCCDVLFIYMNLFVVELLLVLLCNLNGKID